MELETCPHCFTRVVPKADGSCPSCGKQFSAILAGFSGPAEETFPDVQAAHEKKQLFPQASSNPYQSPNYLSQDEPVEKAPSRGILWTFFSFEGRIPRRVYWGASIVATVLFYAGVFGAVMAFGEDSDEANIAVLGLYVPFIWTSLAISVKRWHDRGKSGWWVLIGAIPLLGPIWQFVETGCLRGTYGNNRYGADPT